ncbi:MAG: hypothetical protein IT341_10760 [Chloroflexi bacterium]|nr:hypothetical protein [Chloroflexota bacterium]
MSIDFHAIGTALASAYANVTPPTDERSVQFADLPRNNLSSFPCVIVYPPEWETAYQSGARETTQTWTVRFYRGRMSGDVNADTTALLKWATVLVDATHAASKLGLSYVRKAIPAGGLVGVHNYGNIDYGVVELEVGVWTEDAVTLVA